MKKIKVRWNGETHFLGLIHGKIYEVLSIEKGWYRIIDETGEDYLYPPNKFEKVEVNIMQNEKIIDDDHVECPLYGRVVNIDRCVDIHDVVHRIRIPSILPEKILEIENFREICWNCPHHHFG